MASTDDFVFDYQARRVSCPAGFSVPITPSGHAKFNRHCRTCPLRSRCTRSKDGLQFTLTAHDDELAAARRQWRAKDGLDEYKRWRPMAERSISWLVAHGHRRVRYHGVVCNRIGLSVRVAALNLRRLVNLGLVHEGAWRLASG